MGDVITKAHFNLEDLKSLSPFYAEKLRNIRYFDDIELTTKNDLLDAQAKHPPFGNFTVDRYNVQQIYRTSGTTTKPLLLSFSAEDIDYISDIGADCFRFSEMGSDGNDEVVINCLNLSMWAGGFFDAQSMMKTGVKVINFGTGNTTELIKLVQDLAHTYKVSLHCTPSYLPSIEKRLDAEFSMTPSALGLRRLYLGAEGGVQDNSFRNALMNLWNCRVFNANYGMSEICSIMASADHNNILKFSDMLFANYLVELKTHDGGIVPMSECKEGMTGELILTSVKKQSQPLVRYYTKENILIEKVDKSFYIRIVGRTDDMIVVKGINFFPEQLRNVVSSYDVLTGVYQLQVHKDKNGMINNINLICELNNSSEPFDSNALREKLEKRIREEMTVKVDVNFTYNFEVKGNKLKLVEIVGE